MGKRIDLGPVLPIHKGDWKAGIVYERLNTVRHNSASWVCKATSTTAEPSDSSSDWFLQSEDSVSVASVNGQTGVVRITNTLTTPADDDDSTLIANTAWVNDRIVKALDDVDAAIGTASVDVLNQATAHTAETVSNAINNYDTENASKFISKTELDVVRSNTVDIVKDQVIDGVKTFNKPIEGSITGSSTKASQDALGNTIDTTYATKTELSTEIQTLTVSTAADIDAVEKNVTDIAASIKTTTDKLAQDIVDNATTASNIYATKQSITDLTSGIETTYLSKTDAASTYTTPSTVDTKISTAINTLDTELSVDIESVRVTANAAFPASKITYGTEELEAGVSPLATGSIYFMYE